MKIQKQLGFIAAGKNLMIMFLPSLLIIISTVLPAKALLKGDPNLLKMTEMAQKNNTERIETWQGSSQVEVIYEDSNGVMLKEIHKYDFLFSNKEEATRWKCIVQERYVRKEDKLTLDDSDWIKDVTNEMRKDDAFYVCKPGYITKEGEKGNTLVILPSNRAEEGVYSYSFDPMWYLKGPITTGDVDDLEKTLMFFYRKANDPNFAPRNTLEVKRDDNLVIFETRLENIINRYEFDLSKGGSIVKYYGESNNDTELREWTYEEKNGVWIPKTFMLNFKCKTPRANGRTKSIMKVTFVENTLNQPIPPSEFSLEKLGVTIGTRVSDRKRGFFYLYNGSEKLSPDKDTKQIKSLSNK